MCGANIRGRCPGPMSSREPVRTPRAELPRGHAPQPTLPLCTPIGRTSADGVDFQGWPRGVAQLGSARRSGRRGRRFKSCHPDHCPHPDERSARTLHGSERFSLSTPAPLGSQHETQPQRGAHAPPWRTRAPLARMRPTSDRCPGPTRAAGIPREVRLPRPGHIAPPGRRRTATSAPFISVARERGRRAGGRVPKSSRGSSEPLHIEKHPGAPQRSTGVLSVSRA